MNNIETMSPSAILEQWDREYDIENFFLNEDCVLTEGIIQDIADGLVKAIGRIIEKIKDPIDKITDKNKNEKNEKVRKVNDKTVEGLKKGIDDATKLQDEAKNLNKETDPEEVKKKARKIKHIFIDRIAPTSQILIFLNKTVSNFVQYIEDIDWLLHLPTFSEELLRSSKVNNQVEKYNESGKVPNLQIFVYVYPSDGNPVATVEENNKEYKVHELIPSAKKDILYVGIFDSTEDNLKMLDYREFKLDANKSFDEYFANKNIKPQKIEIETEDDED
jgi:hypothetical protein